MSHLTLNLLCHAVGTNKARPCQTKQCCSLIKVEGGGEGAKLWVGRTTTREGGGEVGGEGRREKGKEARCFPDTTFDAFLAGTALPQPGSVQEASGSWSFARILGNSRYSDGFPRR